METLLTKESFELYLKDSRVKAFPTPGVDGGKLLLHPLNKSLSLLITVHEEPDLTLSERLRWETLEILPGDALLGHLVLQADDELYEGYLLLADIVAEFSSHKDLGRAVVQSTSKFADLIETESLLSNEKQLGLLGELLVLRELIELTSCDAVRFWQGPVGAEHDFVLNSLDVEVKTTKSERRQHKIGSIQQLIASPGRNLHLVSVQLTRASSSGGFSLSDVVSGIANLTGPYEAQFFDGLNRVGWRSRHSHLYSEKYSFRSETLVFKVNDSFPRLVPSSLNLDPDLEPRISDIEYRLNLENLEPNETLQNFLGRGVNLA